jgi:hypothetical protein
MSKPFYNDFRDITVGDVAVYRNLTKNCWSIKDLQTNRVIGHAARLEMTGVSFLVSEKGRQRVLRERKKYVHASAVGTCEPLGFPIDKRVWHRVKYNPYLNTTFVDNFTESPVKFADFVRFEDDGKVYYAFAS